MSPDNLCTVSDHPGALYGVNKWTDTASCEAYEKICTGKQGTLDEQKVSCTICMQCPLRFSTRCDQQYGKVFAKGKWSLTSNSVKTQQKEIDKFENEADARLVHHNTQPPGDNPVLCSQLLCGKDVCTQDEAKTGFDAKSQILHPSKPGGDKLAYFDLNTCYLVVKNL
jgi:hypothetical protein